MNGRDDPEQEHSVAPEQEDSVARIKKEDGLLDDTDTDGVCWSTAKGQRRRAAGGYLTVSSSVEDSGGSHCDDVACDDDDDDDDEIFYSSSRTTWERIWIQPALPDDRFAIAGVKFIDGSSSVKLLKFVAFTFLGIFAMFAFVRWVVCRNLHVCNFWYSGRQRNLTSPSPTRETGF
jgi:hypothetical protein